MRQFLILCIILSVFVQFYCGHTELSTFDYSRLSYDINKIAIFGWDTTKYVFPSNSDPLPLSQSDIALIDSLLTDAIDSFNATTALGLYHAFEELQPAESFKIDLRIYKRQLFPYKDVNGKRVVVIFGFNDEFERWRSELYFPARDHYGIKMFELNLNLSDTTRNNVRTGSYG
jgi:hypothetical protein